MASITRRLNSPPTSTETLRLQHFIRSREREIENISIEILEEEKQVQICEDAIWNLESAIPLGKDAVKMHENHLSALTQIQSQLSEYRLVAKLETKEEVHSRGLYEEMKRCDDALVNRSSSSLDNEVPLLQNEVRTLWDQVRNLEIELKSWKTSLSLSQDILKNQKEFKAQIEASLEAARASFRPILKVPPDTWLVIFRIVVFEEFEDYVKNNPEVPLRSAALVLSRVCQPWRQILSQEANLWYFVTAHTSQQWSSSKYSLFAHCTTKTSSPFIIVINLSQRLCWRYNQVQTTWNDYSRTWNTALQFQNHLGQSATIASPDWNTILAAKQYKLHINMSDDRNIVIQKASFLPFRAPIELILSSRLPIQYGFFFTLLSHFNATKSLTIVNDYPTLIPVVDLASTLPHLTALTFCVKTFPTTFQLAGFLTTTLESLYLRHETPTSFGLSFQIILPRLKTLGITSPGSSFFQWVRMPSLQTMTIYGPLDFSDTQLSSGTAAIECYKGLRHVQFEDWRRPKEEEASLGVVSFFREMANNSHLLQSVKFIRSWVNGEGLLTMLESVSQAVDPNSLNKLEVITLDRTTGIMREECNLLKDLVKRLDIFV